MLREAGGFKVGGGAAEPTNGVKTQHQLAWVHMRPAITKPRHITRHRQWGGWFFFGLKRVADVGRDATPLPWHAGAPRCHLFVILNWQRAQEAEVLHKTLPGMAQRWRTDPSPNPHCYSLMMQRDLQSTHSQTSSRAGWEMKRGGFAVFTRVLYRGTELTANTGLLIEHNLQGFRRSRDLTITRPMFSFKFVIPQKLPPSGFVLK